jgi:hypothetical protein
MAELIAHGNYVSDEGDTVAREAYGPNYDRLVAVTLARTSTSLVLGVTAM